MSTDNVLAIAAAAHGDLLLLALGLGLSIPLVMFGGRLLASLIDRYPILIYLGAGILGKTAGAMIMTDSFTARTLQPGAICRHCAEAACAFQSSGHKVPNMLPTSWIDSNASPIPQPSPEAPNALN